VSPGKKERESAPHPSVLLLFGEALGGRFETWILLIKAYVAVMGLGSKTDSTFTAKG